MKILIIGMGAIGRTVLANLVNEDHTITIIDENKEKVESLIERYDVMGVVGNGACLDVQLEAGVDTADTVIVVTQSDEVNILACLVAKKAGAGSTIARVRNPEYRKQAEQMKEELGLSLVVNPELETADEIFNLISLPSVSNVEHFAKSRVALVEVEAEKGCALIGETLISAGKKFDTQALICAIQRDGKVIIPSGSFEIKEGDKISFTADTKALGDFLEEINMVEKPFKNVMIVGGGRVGYYLAEALSEKRYKVKVIENNKAQAEEMAELLPKVNVVYGNGTSHSVLIEEGIEAMDVFVALTGNDEANIIVSMFANEVNVRKAITQVMSGELIKMLGGKQLEHSVSPKHIAASKIISYVRSIANKRGSNVLTLSRLVNDQVEALEFLAKSDEKFYNIPLKKLKMKENCLIACIIRDNQVIIPRGGDFIQKGDTVVVVTTHKNFDDLTDLIG
ncbi:MAG: Trk system potassium transporter TrkA [Clostridiales bacterium]|nr:Trk system potassium transporter TrkA [Clostridiales bacterium]